MKMRIITKYLAWLACILLLAAGACTPGGKLTPDEVGEHRCTLRIVGGVIPFDGIGTKAGDVFTPSKNSRLYVRMVGAAGPVLGQATYDEELSEWSFTYNGSLAGATSGEAHAVLFDKSIESENSVGLKLHYYTPIYEDSAASFAVDESGISLHASLAPKTGRLSLVHDLEEGQSRYISRVGGISYYCFFDLSSFSFQSQDLCKYDNGNIVLKRGESGNGEYIYGFFTEEEDPRIMLYYSNRYYYKYMPQAALQAGVSGYLDVPDVNAAGWKGYDYSRDFWINRDGDSGCRCNVYFVPGGSFMMGNDADETARPAHKVTLKPYYMGNYEVTRNQWYNIMGEPADWKGSDLPADSRTYEEIQKFITALQAYSTETAKFRFRLPTEAEWEFAARGGIFSRGYMYSGGNTLSEVAVHQADYAVGLKNSNELGLCDMSGNIAELCADWYGPYPSEAQVNPTGPASGEYRVVRGGYAYDEDEYFTVWHRATTEEYGGLPSTAVGFRLVMEAPIMDVE